MPVTPPAPKSSWAETKQLLCEIRPSKPTFTEKDYPKLNGKVVVVTGANTGIGYQTVKSLAGSTNAKLYIFARNKQKTLDAIERLKEEVSREYKKSAEVEFVQVDLSDLDSIKPAAQEFLSKESRLDIIIHNAGVMTPPVGSKTAQGYELQWGTNVIGPHLLQKFLDPLFIATSKTNKPGESRIVWTSSAAHMNTSVRGGIHWHDVNFEKNPNASPFDIYGQSKAGNCIETIQWKLKHPEATNVTTVTLCPGFLKTELQRNVFGLQARLFNLVLHPARYGAYTELFAALSPSITKSGEFVIPWGKVGLMRSDVREGAEGENGDKFWKYAEKEIAPYL